ncbi:MAG: mechanosensitive ion channel [Flavobacteriales bacterium]|nr:MAG: mechanosensitive ion channel [Flavobacteriales bacterium]
MFKKFFSETNSALVIVIFTVVVLLLCYALLLNVLNRYGKNPKYLIPLSAVKKISSPLLLILGSIMLRVASLRELLGLYEYEYWFKKASTLVFIFAGTWLVLNVLKITKRRIMERYDVDDSDNLKARKVATQFNILERIAIFVVVIIAMGLALMSFESIREIGVSIFASAGVAGIIIGLSAQKMIGTILAGIQIAIAQPIKLDDVVIVEGEWGRIEEITLTYVVIKIWDKRRLVVPTTYFIEQPFQNWTKSSADLVGSVMLYTDYQVPFEALRQELGKILEATDLWDGEVQNIQVTDSKAGHMEVRALMSAKDASSTWDLRVHVREQLITFLQRNYPESLVHYRLYVKNMPEGKNMLPKKPL